MDVLVLFKAWRFIYANYVQIIYDDVASLLEHWLRFGDLPSYATFGVDEYATTTTLCGVFSVSPDLNRVSDYVVS